MKRTAVILLTLLVIVFVQRASAQIVEAALPDTHIAREIVIDGVNVKVDADVYGAGVSQVQAYRLWTLDPDEQPEKTIDLSAFFGETEIIDRRALWTADDLYFEAADGERLWTSKHYVGYKSGKYERLNAESRYVMLLYDWAQTMGILPESPIGGEIEGFSVADAVEKMEPIASTLGVALEDEPIVRISMDLEKLNATTQAHLDYGVAPHELCIEDWTAQDEHYRMWLPMVYHGLRVMPMCETPADYRGQETPWVYAEVWMSRDGLECLNMDFVPGEEQAVGEPFVPLTTHEVLDACLQNLKGKGEQWGYGNPQHYNGVHDARIEEIRLGYVMIPCVEADSEGDTTVYEAKPAWYMAIEFETEAQNAGWIDMDGQEHEGKRMQKIQKTVAIDAQTGESLLWW